MMVLLLSINSVCTIQVIVSSSKEDTPKKKGITYSEDITQV